MIYILSKDWRRVASFKEKFSPGTVQGCGSLEDLLKKESKKNNCVIIDGFHTTEERNKLKKVIDQSSLNALVFFIGNEKEGCLAPWKNLEHPLTLSYLQEYFGSHGEKPSNILIGDAPCMVRLRKKIEKASKLDCPIHLYGETGTGKEVVARLLAEKMGQQDKMVIANCAEFTPTLAASKLFGVKKGAYTDAREEEGFVQLANGSVLFLDEIEDLNYEVQGLFLRLLEQGTYHRVGEATPNTSHFRLITASNVKLSNLVYTKRLREDLFYRINGLTIVIPPLRKHPEDIPLLINHFFSQKGETRKVDEKGIGQLMEAPWKGNVRQLFSVLRQNIALSEGEETINIHKETLIDQEQFVIPSFF